MFTSYILRKIPFIVSYMYLSGLCECTGIFRGPECNINITIPTVVHEVQGGDICDTSNGDDCRCFVIRTDNILKGLIAT